MELLHRLQLLFPADDYTLLLVIVGLPLLGAIVNGLFGKRLGDEAVSLMALFSVGVPFLASIVAFAMLAFASGGHGEHAEHGEHVVRFVWHGWEWLEVSGKHDLSSVPIEVAFSIDALNSVMVLVVTGVGFLIHLYSTKYMEGDPGYYRFFAYLNLFIFSMLVLILGDNLPMLFIGWEGVGLCSYLLIGFWFQEDANASAGRKAFITNRIGDFGLLVAMAMLVYYVGALDWTGIEQGRGGLLQTIQIWPLGHHVPFTTGLADAAPESTAFWFYELFNKPRYVSVAGLLALALFLGCAGKSAQIPLYVWLPDAMAGPTPVSALIHAATMVTAGVYLVCRMAPVFVLAPAAMFTIALVGALTAVFAATIALAQNDIKKVLAYSTVSQLGYMFLGVGVGAFGAGLFHVVTHAFFKACLFLGAGSVIHAMHARIHDTDASQDMRNMGGLYRYMPYTFWTFLASVAAISGLPFITSGFYSKDEILYRAWTSDIHCPHDECRLPGAGEELAMWQWPSWGGNLLFGLGVLGAVLTAFYMARLAIGIFAGDFRGWQIVPGHDDHAHDDHAHDDHAHDPSEPLEGPEPHESPWQMTLPLVVLGVLAIVAGFFNPHQLGQVVPALASFHPFDSWLDPVFHPAHAFNGVEQIAHPHGGSTALIAIAISSVVALGGLFAAYFVYMMQKGGPAEQFVSAVPWLHRGALNKWYIDELYEETVIGAVDSLADMAVWVDRWIVDGIVAGLTSGIVRATGALLRLLQTGRIQVYATSMVVGLAVLTWHYVTPHVAVKTFENHANGNYRVNVAPGLGYQYRWDKDGDEEWDTEEFGDQRDLRFSLEHDNERTVAVQVKNVFGLRSYKKVRFQRPKRYASGRSNGGNVVIEVGEDGKPRVRGQGDTPTPRAPAQGGH